MALGLTPQQIIDKGIHPLLRISDEWRRIELKYIANVQNGYAFSSKMFNHSKGLPLIRIRDIFSKETENLYSGEYKEEFIVNNGDILIGMDGDFKVSKWPGEKGLLNQRVCRIIFNSNLYNKQFLFLCIQPYLDAIHSETSAVTVKHLSSNTINNIPFPLAPLPEQRAIVAKIEELFSSLDQGIADLKKAQDQLKIYRQAVLKKAFEGDWKNTSVGELFEFVGGGTPSKREKDYWNGNIPWASVKDIKGDYLEKTQDFITEKGLKNSSANLALKDEVILITRISPGKSLVTSIDTAINQDLKIVKPKTRMFNKYIHYLFKSIERTCIKLSSGTTVKGINLTNLKSIKIPVIEEGEQHQIVQEIESRLSVCDKVEQSITESLDKAQALRQSILKKAFEGTLLSEAEIEKCKQAPDYEPASVLLERIKKETLQQAQGNKKKK